jgi:hypothetical protein
MATSDARRTAEGSITVVVHPPERRRPRSTIPALAGDCACCSCCCCCLHSLGALIGAAVAPTWGSSDTMPRQHGDAAKVAPSASRCSAVVVFWITLVVLLLIAVALLWARQGNASEAVVIIAIAFPGLQLAAVIVTAFVLTAAGGADDGYQWRQLGKIFIGAIAGTLIGAAVMGVLAVFLMGLG